ncbi:hypothetical protein AeMF1_000777 [Aphanomyces euteiches]|nr:hypothetical protein AeMF1_000777 [Aphanomyces euteiches]KAH9193316.1 hypothetical protein AeNC1_004716 [Aphanomyces euteiches]
MRTSVLHASLLKPAPRKKAKKPSKLPALRDTSSNHEGALQEAAQVRPAARSTLTSAHLQQLVALREAAKAVAPKNQRPPSVTIATTPPVATQVTKPQCPWRKPTTTAAVASSAPAMATTTLARYRRLIGMTARKKALHYIAQATTCCLAKHRRAVVIQRAYRRYYCSCAATNLQRLWRGCCGRQLAKAQLQLYKKRSRAATQIQCQVRRRLALLDRVRRQVAVANAACRQIQLGYRRYKHRRRRRINAAVQLIQHVVRSHQAKRRKARWRHAMTRFQAQLRGFCVRRTFQQLRHGVIQLQRRYRATKSPQFLTVHAAPEPIDQPGTSCSQGQLLLSMLDIPVQEPTERQACDKGDSSTAEPSHVFEPSCAPLAINSSSECLCDETTASSSELEVSAASNAAFNNSMASSALALDTTRAKSPPRSHATVDFEPIPAPFQSATSAVDGMEAREMTKVAPATALLSSPSASNAAMEAGVDQTEASVQCEESPQEDACQVASAALDGFVRWSVRPWLSHRVKSVVRLQCCLRQWLAVRTVQRRRAAAIAALDAWMHATTDELLMEDHAALPTATTTAFGDEPWRQLFPVKDKVPPGCHVIKPIYLWSWNQSTQEWKSK